MNWPVTAKTRKCLRIATYGAAAFVVAYLAWVAAYPSVLDRVSPWLGWFGQPGSVATITIAAVMVGLACAVAWRAGGDRSVGRPIGVTVALTAVSALLGFSSYAWCHDEAHPGFFTGLVWAGGVVRGGLDDRHVAGHLCPAHAPVALDIARVSALAALFVGVSGIAVALLESRLDRFRLRFDSSVTAIVGADDDADSTVSAIARTLEKNSTLAVITTPADAGRRGELRHSGARIIALDFSQPDALQSLPIWHKVTRLYLLSAEPSTNLHRLDSINHCLPAGHIRRPLTVRIDDPWQAEAWRARQLGGSDSRWAGDAIGRYEATAHRLINRIVEQRQAGRIIVCGTTPLTLAVCADLSRRRLERNFFSEPGEPPLPTVTLVGEDAEEYRQNQEIRLALQGLTSARDWIDAAPQRPSPSSIATLVAKARAGRPDGVAIIIADNRGNPMLATMLATRLPDVPIYAHAQDGPETLDVPPIVGRLQAYRLTMDLLPGGSHDVWERAAKLIHNRYVAQLGGTSPAARPWAQLDEFYRGSNRRQVRNTLWMVEQIAGRVWDSATASPESPPTKLGDEAAPLDRLAVLGIDRTAALAMAEAEHRDWCRYYRAAGWHYAAVRDDDRKAHDGLVSWQNIQSDPVALNRALTSLASTLSALHELGYRSRPAWQQFRRTGTVVAHRHTAPWSWTSASGQTMHADAGDWEVSGEGGDTWSVRDDIFRLTYQPVDGEHWRRDGVVQARPAHSGEVIDTLEGPLTAQPGDWVVRGPAGEQWPVRPEAFGRQYERVAQ